MEREARHLTVMSVSFAGYYRMLAPAYLLQVLQVLLNHIDLNGHPFDRVPTSSTISSLQEIHAMRIEVIEAVLLTWFGKMKGADALTSEEFVEIKVHDIVRFVGLQVLGARAKAKLDKLEDFLIAWQAAVGPTLCEGIDIQILKVRSERDTLPKLKLMLTFFFFFF